MENIDTVKLSRSGKVKYKLGAFNILASPAGLHYIDYLDPTEEISSQIDFSQLQQSDVAYIENMLQSNPKRFDEQVDVVRRLVPLENARVLDVGCGGGLFLSKLKKEGAKVIGAELSDVRAAYAVQINELDIIKRPIEDEFWQSNYPESFDVITLWDVIEHVNYPLSTIKSATKLLKKGGYFCIDTPCKDSFYYRFGEFTYRLTRGKYPTFLKTMYSASSFGHKQIFSTKEMQVLLEQAGLSVIECKKFHELSFPYEFYLDKILKNRTLAKLALPFVHVLLFLIPVKNKMLIIGRKS